MKKEKNNQKFRMTPQRQVILDELRKVDTHPTADKIYEMVRRRMPHISLGTVYRNLDLMADAGLIRRHSAAGSQMRFDGDVAPHYHIHCVRCGRMDDVPASGATAGAGEVHGARVMAAATGYDVLSHRVEFEGVCPACQAKGDERD